MKNHPCAKKCGIYVFGKICQLKDKIKDDVFDVTQF